MFTTLWIFLFFFHSCVSFHQIRVESFWHHDNFKEILVPSSSTDHAYSCPETKKESKNNFQFSHVLSLTPLLIFYVHFWKNACFFNPLNASKSLMDSMIYGITFFRKLKIESTQNNLKKAASMVRLEKRKSNWSPIELVSTYFSEMASFKGIFSLRLRFLAKKVNIQTTECTRWEEYHEKPKTSSLIHAVNFPLLPCSKTGAKVDSYFMFLTELSSFLS